MKTFITIVFVLAAVGTIGYYGTKLNKEKPVIAKEKYEQKIQDELSSGIRNDTILLGYWLGMSESEFDRRTQSLKFQNKISFDGGLPKYDIIIGKNRTYPADCIYSAFFHNDSLYLVFVTVESDEIYSTELIKSLLHLTYGQKYGYDYISIEDQTNNNKSVFWIDGNREISLSSDSEAAYVTYTDLKIGLAIREENIKKARERENQLKFEKQKELQKTQENI